MITVCTFGSPIPDLELWRCARQQVTLLGMMPAIIEANQRIHELGEAGDVDGANTWMAIALRVLHLGSGVGSATWQ